VKPAAKAPRGLNKRRREIYEEDSDVEMMRDEFSTPKRPRKAPLDVPFGLETSDFKSLQSPLQESSDATPRQLPTRFLRRSPRLENNIENCDPADNHSTALQRLPDDEEEDEDATALQEYSPDHPDWSSEDDRKLVELVLEKLRLSKRDWNECARKMGKDHQSVGRRWKALVGEGNVGLRRGRKMIRGRIDESWRK
jgi:hypothetical protein